MRPKKPGTLTALVVRPAQAWEMLGCSNDTGYRLIAAGELESYLDGSARKITIRSIEAYIERRIAASKGKVLRSPQPHRRADYKPGTFSRRHLRKAARTENTATP